MNEEPRNESLDTTSSQPEKATAPTQQVHDANIAGPTPSTPQKSSRSKLPFIIGGAGVFVLLLIGVLGILVVSLLTRVTKEDYSRGSTAANSLQTDLNSAYYDVTGIGASSNSTKTRLDNDIEKAQKSLATYKSSFADLAMQRALRDGDVNEAFKKYEQNHEVFVKKSEAYLSSAAKLFPITIDCYEKVETISQSAGADYKDLITHLDTCYKDIKALGSLPDEDIRSFATIAANSYLEYQKSLKKLDGINPDDYSARRVVAEELYDIDDQVYKKVRDAQSTAEKHFDATNPKDTLTKVSDELFNKSLK